MLDTFSDELPNKKKIIYVGCISVESGGNILFEAMEIVNRKMKVTLELVCRKDEFDALNIPADKYDWLNVRHISR